LEPSITFEIPDDETEADLEADLYAKECVDLIIGPDEIEPE
jgi:hypothetical protein